MSVSSKEELITLLELYAQPVLHYAGTRVSPAVRDCSRKRRKIADLICAATFSSNLARKKWRLEGNGETVETTAEETKIAKPLTTQEFPITLENLN